MLSLVLLSAYSASLISRLAVASPILPFTSIEEFISQKKYKMIVIHKGETFDSIKVRKNNNKRILFTLENLIRLCSSFLIIHRIFPSI